MRTVLSFRIVLAALIGLTVTSPAVAAPDDDPIQNAVKKGVKYLQGVHKPQARYSGGSHNIGSATLAGLALLESGVPETDPALKNIISYVRDNALAQTRTYEISLTIMFLDRLGNPGDLGFIQLLGIRLMTGQGKTGGWSYDCGNALGPQDEARLKAMFMKESRLKLNEPRKDGDSPKKDPTKVVPRKDLPVDPNATPPDTKKEPAKKEPAPKPPGRPPLHPEVVKWAKLINIGGGKDPVLALMGTMGDNSNTQFAALGLWCARKHGVPCDKSLALLDKRFRTSQDADGGWSYSYASGGNGSTAAMTCAGLIALAVAHGSSEQALRNKPDSPTPKKANDKDPAEDEAIKKGLKCLGAYITRAKGEAPDGPINPAKKGRKRFKADDLNGNLYFLWSLERVAVIFGLETIGNHDWYAWGSDALVDTQAANGSWSGHTYHGANDEISTSFALLFLNRANVAQDLSTALKGKVKDPGVSVLRGGGDISKILPDRDPPKAAPKGADPVKPDPPLPTVTGNDFEKEAARLCADLANASEAERPGMLARLRDTKGSVYTEALARAAAKLTGEPQREARAALAKRLTRMTAATLREMLRDENREVRLAAASVSGLKDDRQLLSDLISSLSDNDPLVVQAARMSLKGLSGKDFGPDPEALPAERSKAILAWKAWLKTQRQ